jgi:hypothetical protein
MKCTFWLLSISQLTNSSSLEEIYLHVCQRWQQLVQYVTKCMGGGGGEHRENCAVVSVGSIWNVFLQKWLYAPPQM